MAEETYYCYLDSDSISSTNLQLYSLGKANKEWLDLSKDYKNGGVNPNKLKERLVFVVSCIGLSLSQLLGQNAVLIKKKIDTPEKLLSAFLNESIYDEDRKRSLNKAFHEFIEYYDACRHFGRVEEDKKRKKIDLLTYDKTKDFMTVALNIWNAIIGHHRTGHIDAENIEDILEHFD